MPKLNRYQWFIAGAVIVAIVLIAWMVLGAR
jgi:hypothetical protein